MALRKLVLSATFGLVAAGPALALEAGCTTCYRHVVHPPVYGMQAEKVLVRGPRTLAHVVPAQYETVTETVVVEPARKVWQVSRDAHGRLVGCWVTVPARHAVRHRQVLVRPAVVVPVAVPAVYGVEHRRVLLEPARSGWEPIGERVHDAPLRRLY